MGLKHVGRVAMGGAANSAVQGEECTAWTTFRSSPLPRDV